MSVTFALAILMVLALAVMRAVAVNPGVETQEFYADKQAAMKIEMDGNMSANLVTAGVWDTPSVLPADFTESDFPGYSPVAAIATWTPAFNDAGHRILTSPLLDFTATTIVVPQTVVGIILTLDPTMAEVWGTMVLINVWPVSTGESLRGVITWDATDDSFTFTRVTT